MSKREKSHCLMQRLATEELGFCCIHSFLRETDRYSMSKVAGALGVSPHTVQYWRSKKLRREISRCPSCSRTPRKRLELKKRASGKYYFVRF